MQGPIKAVKNGKLKMNGITSTSASAWQALRQHQQAIADIQIKDEFAKDPERFTKFSLESAGLFLDYSKNRITTETIELLCKLAESADLKAHIEDMFTGQIINTTEKRAVLHTALRNPTDEPRLVDNTNVTPLIHNELQHIQACVEKLHNRSWLGFSNKPITDIVNLGIGGSDLGPAMVVEALKPYANANLRVHFVSNVDATHLVETLKPLNPETTLFIVASKTFTTQETLCNAESAEAWLREHSNNANTIIKRHFLAVTANPERAIKFGIEPHNIFPFWDWVGGRFSLWSAIGLSVALAIGMENFRFLLAGAYMLDEHFRYAPWHANMPVILALLGIWNIDFWNLTSQAIIPYDQYLQLFPAFLQQLEMESNGKRVCLDGSPITYQTAPVIWGSVGTNGQHAFHQLLMQGTQVIPVDFILPMQSHNNLTQHHLYLMANCLAQSQALMQGRNLAEVLLELKNQGMSPEDAQWLALHKVIPGNVPNNMLLIPQITPHTLGALIALYEHKVFVQGVIWQINSFDQWGVELGKQLAAKIIPKLQKTEGTQGLDASTLGLIEKITGTTNL